MKGLRFTRRVGEGFGLYRGGVAFHIEVVHINNERTRVLATHPDGSRTENTISPEGPLSIPSMDTVIHVDVVSEDDMWRRAEGAIASCRLTAQAPRSVRIDRDEINEKRKERVAAAVLPHGAP